MSLPEQARSIGRVPFTAVEIDLPSCKNTYGVGQCQAALGTTGDAKCFNSRATCQDPVNFDAVGAQRFDVDDDAITQTGTFSTENTKAITIVVAYNRLADVAGFLFDARDGLNTRLRLQVLANGQLSVNTPQRSGLGNGLALDADPGRYQLAMFSVDGAQNLALAGTEAGVNTETTASNVAFDYSVIDDSIVGGVQGASVPLRGGCGFLYINTGEFVDFRLAANRRKVLNAAGVLRDLSGGILGTKAPEILLRGRSDEFRFNQGTGGDFTAGAATVDATSMSFLEGTLQTVRFYQNNGVTPQGYNGLPLLRSVSFTPAELDVEVGIGKRANVAATLDDAPHHDRGIDPYVDDRAYDPATQGSFWGRLLARHPYYAGRWMRVLTGYLEDGAVLPENIETRTYTMDDISWPDGGGRVRLTGKDFFKFADNGRAKAPGASRGRLGADIDAVQGSLTVTPADDIVEDYPLSGYIRVNKEVMAYTRSGGSFTVTRAQFGTVADDHDADATVQACYSYAADVPRLPQDIVYDLLTTFAAELNPELIDKAQWDAQGIAVLFQGVVTSPVGLTKLVNEICEQAGFYLFIDDVSGTIKLRRIQPASAATINWNDDQHLLAGRTRAKKGENFRISRVWVFYGQVNPTLALDDGSNYETVEAVVSDAEAPGKYLTPKIREVYSRWIPAGSRPVAQGISQIMLERYSETPNVIELEVDAKDATAQPGDLVKITTRQIPDFFGLPTQATYLLLSRREVESGTRWQYTAIQERYSGQGDELVIEFAAGNDYRVVDARTEYDKLYAAPEPGTQVRFLVRAGAVLGSNRSDNGFPGFTVDNFPPGVDITVEVLGRIAGAGGFAFDADVKNGGIALKVGVPITLEYTSGEIWGGGGAGGNASNGGGGGGAGVDAGDAFDGSAAGGDELGGNGAGDGGDGGDAGQAGQAASAGAISTPGAAGLSIDGIGFVTVSGTAGDLRGPTA